MEPPTTCIVAIISFLNVWFPFDLNSIKGSAIQTHLGTEGKNQALVGAIPYCGEYPGPRFEDKFRSANQMDGISKADEIKWLPVNL